MIDRSYDVTIRPASQADVPSIQNIARRTWADTYLGLIPEEAQSRILNRAYSDAALAISIGRSQAFLVAEVRATAAEAGEVRRAPGEPQRALSEARETPGKPRNAPDEARGTTGGVTISAHATSDITTAFASTLAGYVDLDFDGKQLNLHRLYVLPEYQRHGIGRRLLDSAVASVSAVPSVSPREGISLVAHVERDNPKARAFYRRAGFAEDEEEIVVMGGISLPVIRISMVVGKGVRDGAEDDPGRR